ncbi:MAG: hypothetical protein HQK76_15715 [Desulfobacterales bacterium]|nr:hypothetical protein [Desulfobacterales bacterium]
MIIFCYNYFTKLKRYLKKFWVDILIICLFYLISPNYLFSDSDIPKVLLINSSYSVEKYKIVHEEFKKSLSFHIKEIDLEGKHIEDINMSELKSTKPDLIYCIGSKAYSLASYIFLDTNIVFSSIINCKRLRISPRIYGVANELNNRMQIFIFRSIFPDIKKIGVPFSKKFSSEWLENAQQEAKELEIEIISGEVTTEHSILETIKSLFPKINALWLIADPLVMFDKSYLYKILELCDKQQIPVFSYNEAFAELGAVLIVSADEPTIGNQSAGIALEVLSGNKPDERIQFPAGSSITLNLKKTEEYKLEYNKNALGTINNIIK